MSTSKYMDKICIWALITAMVIGILFANGGMLGIGYSTRTLGYEDRLFDTGKVHTIDILIDDWEEFLASAQSEAYTVCDVVIDGEPFNDVGIRGKGNTSLSTVSSMNSDRYSFKIEFDQYDSTKSYHGLDKLSLNNLIQDNTMMKDYLTYQMMAQFGVAAPLCSYAYITVNGEDWGLYLAVEAVEESFLRRNYGNDYGQLYKPDSMNMGGGRGNGMEFNLDDFLGTDADTFPEGSAMPDGWSPGEQGMPGMNGGASGDITEDFDPSQQGSLDFMGQSGRQPGGNFGGMNMAMGSEVTRLQYIDDQISSYSTIFDSAKTDITEADQQRLIGALKTLSQGQTPAEAVDTEAVIRYFVVHNYVVNGDSYTGSMIHNYYLYEEDGVLSMIPWDYNLAFGTFQGGDATGAVSDDIDTPLSVTGSDRPMIDWIFASEEYTELYHTYFREFLDTVDPASITARTKELIAPYVEKDPTKFCTYEAFEQGVDALTEFCSLRSQSIAQQLEGKNGTVDASDLSLSDMGTMSQGMGGGKLSGNTQMPEFDTGDREDQIGGRPASGDFPANSGEENFRFPGMNPMEGMTFPEGMGQMPFGQVTSLPGQGEMPVGTEQWVLIGITGVVLLAGLFVAFKWKRY